MLFCNTAGPHRSGIMAASRSVICRQLIVLMRRPVTSEDDVLRGFRQKLRMTSVIRQLMIFFDYRLIHIAAVLIFRLDSASEPVNYLVWIVKQIFRLALVTCSNLRTAGLAGTCLYRKFTLNIVSCVFGIVVMCNTAEACIINYLVIHTDVLYN